MSGFSAAIRGLPLWCSGKESACQCGRDNRCGFNPCLGKISWCRKWQTAPVFLPGKSHGQRNVAGYSPWGPKSGTTTKHSFSPYKKRHGRDDLCLYHERTRGHNIPCKPGRGVSPGTESAAPFILIFPVVV